MRDMVAVMGRERSAGDVAVLHRMSTVLDAFSTANPERTVSDVATATGLPTSTAHRLLASLTAIGLLERPAREPRIIHTTKHHASDQLATYRTR